MAFTSLNSNAIEPEYSLVSSGAVTSLFIENDILYVANDAGSIDIFNWKKKTKIKSISFPSIKDFMGDEIPPKIYSIDKLNDQIIAVTQGKHGFRNVFTINNDEITKIFDADKDKLMVKKALFIDSGRILISTLGNEIMLYNISETKFEYKKQISTSVFSDIDINEDKTQAVTSDESGIIHLIDIETGDLVKEFIGMNLDNVYQVVYNNNMLVGAGQDRRVSVYHTKSAKSYFIESSFIVYCVGMSDDEKWAAFSMGEDNYIKVFNTSTKSEKAILKGQKSTLTQIKFVGDYIITSSEDKYIMVWKWN